MEHDVRDQVDKKIFLLSLDGATFDVLRPLIKQGYLPNLEKAIRNGISADLESVIPPVTAPAWTSFMTGKNPNKHGIFDFTRFDSESYEWKLNNSQHIRAKSIWQILSDKGKRVVVIGLPYLYPAYKINGLMVAGWDAPTMTAATFPESLVQKVLEILPDYGSALDLSLWNYLPADSDADFTAFIGKLTKSFEQTATLASHFLKNEPWDGFMVHFQPTDWIQHKLWGYIEKACSDPDDKHPRLEQVRECYQAFDRQVGHLLEEVGPLGATQIILSDHGFGANHGTICPNYLLLKLGLYQLKSDSEGALQRSIKRSRHEVLRKLYRALVRARDGFRARHVLKKYKSWADMVNHPSSARTNIDWTSTKAAFVGGSETGFIFINVKGRGTYGCVEPGEEYELVAARIISAFSAAKNPKTGKKLFERVVRGSAVYASPADGVSLPDIVLIPQKGYVVGAGLSEVFLSASGELGDHRHNGVVILQGERIKRSIPDFYPHLIDLAPTILHALGLTVPDDMDGRVLQEIFSESRPIRFEKADSSLSAEPVELGDVEAALIEQRLRALGYVD